MTHPLTMPLLLSSCLDKKTSHQRFPLSSPTDRQSVCIEGVSGFEDADRQVTYMRVLYSQNHRMRQKRMIYVLENGRVVKRCDRLLSSMTNNCADATRPLLLPPQRKTCARPHMHVSHFSDFNVPSTAQGHLRTFTRTHARTYPFTSTQRQNESGLPDQ